jgi:ABC-type dipeptide/oligopeptide/nickel transport system permease subunit
VGGLLVGLLVIVALFAPILAPHDPVENFFMLPDRDGELRMAPFEPGEVPGFPLGSDLDGRDILSRMMWAVRPTLVLAMFVATVRLVLGTLLGFLEGWYGGVLGDIIGSVTRVALGIPLLIIAIVIIYVLGFRFEAWVFIIALTVTGWASATVVMSERARLIRGEPFIEAARAVGARERRLLWHHLLPQVRTLVIVTWTFEMSAVLLQLAELGFLGFFLGGGAIRLIPDPESGGFIRELIAGMPEMGQMLSAGWDNFLNAPRIALLAGTAFFFAIFSFQMLGEGLKRYYADRNRSVPAPESTGPVAKLAKRLRRPAGGSSAQHTEQARQT